MSDDEITPKMPAGGREKRPVLVVVPHWPDGTMAFKFGSALLTALGVKRGEATLVQFAPERIFRAETNVTLAEFREALSRLDVSCPGPVYFIDIGSVELCA